MRRCLWAGLALTLLVLATSITRAQESPAAHLEKVPPLDAAQLAGVRDDTPFGNWQRAAPEEMPPDARAEEAVFWQAVFAAAKVPAEDFAQAADAHRYLTFGHLYNEPTKYRGQVVHIEGRLWRLKRLDPPHHIQLKGIGVLYEAWIYLDGPGTHPVCALLPHVPEGVQVGDGLNRRVSVDGYFFKRYRYISGRLDAAGKNESLSTVLLIAPTGKLIEAVPRVAGAGQSAGPWWTWLGGFAAVVALLMIGLIWWLRHHDRLVQTRLDAVRNIGFANGRRPATGEESICMAPGLRQT